MAVITSASPLLSTSANTGDEFTLPPISCGQFSKLFPLLSIPYSKPSSEPINIANWLLYSIKPASELILSPVNKSKTNDPLISIPYRCPPSSPTTIIISLFISITEC